MTMEYSDYRILAGISEALQDEYRSENQEWEKSPFAWIKSRPSRQIGAIGEKLVAGWLAARGFNVVRANNSDADRIVEGKRAEIKFSTRWENGSYKFQQLRDQDYDLAICLGISPSEAHCWVIPKADIRRLWKKEHAIQSQHGGQDGADTAWIDVRGDNPPSWMRQYGGSLSEAIRILSRVTGFEVNSLSDSLDDYQG
jgi:hypothetical protein